MKFLSKITFLLAFTFSSLVSFAQKNELKPLESLGIPAFEMPYSDVLQIGSMKDVLNKFFQGKDYSGWEVASCELGLKVDAMFITVSSFGGKFNEDVIAFLKRAENNLPQDLYVSNLTIYNPTAQLKELHKECIIRLSKAE